MGACNRQNNTASRVDERSAPPGGPTCEVQSILFPDSNVSTNNWTWVTEFNTQKSVGCRSVNCSYYGLPGIFPTSSPTWRCGPTQAMVSSFLRFLLVITLNDAPQSVGLLWTSDQLVAENSTWQNSTITTDRHPCRRWASNPQSKPESSRRPTSHTVRQQVSALPGCYNVKICTLTIPSLSHLVLTLQTSRREHILVLY
jgi:hypothetical protein